MRDQGIVDYTLPGLPNVRGVMLSRYADVQAVLRDPHFGRGDFRPNVLRVVGEGPLADSYSLWFLFQDPPDHSRLRGLVSRAFTPRAVNTLRHKIDELVQRLLDRQSGQAAFDLVADFAYEVPVLVICELLGVPQADRGTFSEWSAALAKGLDSLTVPDQESVRRGNAAAAGLTAYFDGLIQARHRRPGEDLLSALIAVEEGGVRLSQGELVATCLLLFFAGHETTVNLIGNGVLALLRNPSQLERLRHEPALMPGAVEELRRRTPGAAGGPASHRRPAAALPRPSPRLCAAGVAADVRPARAERPRSLSRLIR